MSDLSQTRRKRLVELSVSSSVFKIRILSKNPKKILNIGRETFSILLVYSIFSVQKIIYISSP